MATKRPYPVEILSEDDDDGTMVECLKEFSEAVIGHRIIKVDQNIEVPGKYGGTELATAITLDDGKRVSLLNNSDCCAYTDLEGFLLNAETIDHVITGVGTTDGYETWHIYADFGDVLQLKVGWSCGNPFYYAYGFHIQVEDIYQPMLEELKES